MDVASSSGGPKTVSSAKSNDKRIGSLYVMVKYGGDEWCAGAACLDTGCRDSYMSSKVLVNLVRRGILTPGNIRETNREYTAIDGRTMKALGRTVLTFRIGPKRYRCVFIIVPDNRTYEFLLGEKFLLRKKKLMMRKLMNLYGPKKILELANSVAQEFGDSAGVAA